jgi:hypothetical protein
MDQVNALLQRAAGGGRKLGRGKWGKDATVSRRQDRTDGRQRWKREWKGKRSGEVGRVGRSTGGLFGRAGRASDRWCRSH